MKNRTYLITKTQISLLKTELEHLHQYCIVTPDSDASYRLVFDILRQIAGE